MDIDFIERLIDIFEKSSLLELDFAEGDARVRLSRIAGETVPVASGPQGQTMASPVARAPGAAAPPVAPAPAKHMVAAGMVGTFYRRPAPDRDPYVEVGETVEDGQTLALLEAMKMLIPVEADRAGRIAAILVEDATLIETGTPLFVIEPLG